MTLSLEEKIWVNNSTKRGFRVTLKPLFLTLFIRNVSCVVFATKHGIHTYLSLSITLVAFR